MTRVAPVSSASTSTEVANSDYQLQPVVTTTKSGRAMTAHEHSILTFCEQFYTTHSRLPNTGDVCSVGFEKNDFHKLLKLPAFQRALEVRGIVPYTMLDANGKPPAHLSADQLDAVNTMMDPYDTRSAVKRLKDLSLSSQTWNTWLRNPTFRSYLQQRGETLLKDSGWEAHYSLVNRVRQGDLGAIRYFNEITGRFTPAATKGVDVHGILFQVLEIIQKRVGDQNTQQLIAQDLLALVEPVAAQLDGVPIVAKEFKEIAGVAVEVKSELLSDIVDSDSDSDSDDSTPVHEVVPEPTSPYSERPTTNAAFF